MNTPANINTTDKIGFTLFVSFWNKTQNLSTPDIHLHIAHWMEQQWHAGQTRLLLMAFRSAGKSTLVGLFCAWLIYQNPNIRILILAADQVLAGKMVRNVKRIIERFPVTANLKPERIDQWASDRFTVVRELELRDPTMIARGVTSNITGSRADIVICDDVEVPNTSDSEEKREALRARLMEIPYVLIAGGAQFYVGTPHSYFSIYADVPREEIGEDKAFLEEFERMIVPIIDDSGNPIWPERYTPEAIEQMKIDTGPNKFESQMMLKPVNIMDSRLNAELLQFYSGDIEYCKITDALYLGQTQMVDVRTWWDPSFAAAKGDDSVLAVVFGDKGGNYYIHHIEFITLQKDKSENAQDEATQQAKIVANIVKQYHLPALSVETNGIGMFLPSILRNVLREERISCGVNDSHSSKNKQQRILEAFDAPLAAQKIFVHERVKNTNFVMQMREWNPKSGRAKDDALDAVSSAILAHPIRTERLHNNLIHRSQSWRRGAKPHNANGDFDV